jgi:hypothetical protein
MQTVSQYCCSQVSVEDGAAEDVFVGEVQPFVAAADARQASSNQEENVEVDHMSATASH